MSPLTVLAEHLPVIGGHDDQGVLVEVTVLEEAEDPPEVLVRVADLGVVEGIELPPIQLVHLRARRQETLRVGVGGREGEVGVEEVREDEEGSSVARRLPPPEPG